jgi:RNA polymerase sigma-70 factor (ECF subfamily)
MKNDPATPAQPPPVTRPAAQVEVEDRELAARLRRGDPAALQALYHRYAGTVLALLLRIVGNRGEAEDLLQDVFLQAWRRAPEFDPQRGSFAAWLFTIARNRALDVVRSPRHRAGLAAPSPSSGDAGDPPGADGVGTAEANSPEESASLKERAQAVQRALSELSPAQREAIEMAYYGGLSHSEIASKTGEPLGTIKSRIGQAAARLRAVLHQLGGG